MKGECFSVTPGTHPAIFNLAPVEVVFKAHIDTTPYSGVARTPPLLGHSMGTLHLYELPCEVQKPIGGSGGILPRNFRNFTSSQVLRPL